RSQSRFPGGPEITSYGAATGGSMVATSAGFAVLTGKGDGCGVGAGVGVGVCAEAFAPNSTITAINSAARVRECKQILCRTISSSPLSSLLSCLGLKRLDHELRSPRKTITEFNDG